MHKSLRRGLAVITRVRGMDPFDVVSSLRSTNSVQTGAEALLPPRQTNGLGSGHCRRAHEGGAEDPKRNTPYSNRRQHGAHGVNPFGSNHVVSVRFGAGSLTGVGIRTS